ncbi:MAG TPA: PilZ domain-containing protein, partial [Candidatus Acidoferrum sp.]|nr:PilZ domain-containing protein [Candidatus Acidoferrum sp.]
MKETFASSNLNAGNGHRLAKPAGTGVPADRRKRRRALISAPIRIRAVDVTQGGPDQVSTTLDVSPNGVLFVTSDATFTTGMEVAVTFPYTKSAETAHAEQSGRVVRVSEMGDGRRSVAIALGLGVGEDIVD